MNDKAWGKTVKKELIEREMTVTDLTNALGVSREAVCATISGRKTFPRIIKKINDYLGLGVQEEK